MCPRTKQQFEVIRAEKSELIMQTALVLFAKKGYESTSVGSIAKKAGISKGLMYNYFQSKEDLLTKITINSLSQFSDVLQIENQEHIKKEELIRFIDGNLLLLKESPDFFKLYFSLSAQPGVFALLEQEILKVFLPLMEVFSNYYSQKGDKNPDVKARFLLAVFDGIGIHYLVDTKNFPIDEIRDMIIELL